VGGQPVYLDVQIEARSLKANKRNATTFAALEVRNPRKNFFFILYSEQAGCYWVMPSLDLVKEANRNKTGANKGKYRIVFTNHSQKTGKVRPRSQFERYRNNFEMLRNYRG
jgi:hypothetical protein